MNDQTDGLRQLQALTDSLQQKRTNRRNLMRGVTVASGATALGLAPSIGTAAPGDDPGLGPPTLAQGLAPGAALVTSLRLPMRGIGSTQTGRLLFGEVANWHEVGCPIPLPVTVFAIDNMAPQGSSPAETVADYEALVAKLDETPGGLAMVRIEMIDSRVNTLEIDGLNPLVASGTEAEPIVKVGVAGDIIFGRNGGNRQRDFGDYSMPMYQVKDFLSTFDVTVANFECFVSETIEPPEIDNPYTLDFVTGPESLQGLALAGIDAVTMANNHAVYSDAGYGLPGMRDTIRYLNEADIPPFGVGESLDEARAPWTIEVNGLSIAFYGVDGVTANIDIPVDSAVVDVNVAATATEGGTNPLQMDQCAADIERLAGEHDIVLPYFHMGEQYKWSPVQWVVDVSRQCIDAGATAMISSHPHATMGMEFYKGKPIFYSIGNFVYDQMFSVETRQGYFLDLTFRGKNLVGFRTHGVEIMDFVQPRFMSSREQAGFTDRFWRSVDLTRAKFG